MNNVRSIITSHNTRIIRKSQTQVTSVDNCNCRNKEACPLQNKCMNKDIVYKATISTSNANDTKHYIGMTSSTFKERYRNHIYQIFHTQKIFKRNGTFETHLAPKAKQNRFKTETEIISACQHKNRFQVKSLNKERNACYFNDNTPTFPP